MVHSRLTAALMCVYVSLLPSSVMQRELTTAMHRLIVRNFGQCKALAWNIHTSQLNSMSDSIVQILTLKFLACFLNSELKPIFATKVLAMANWSIQQSKRCPSRQSQSRHPMGRGVTFASSRNDETRQLGDSWFVDVKCNFHESLWGGYTHLLGCECFIHTCCYITAFVFTSHVLRALRTSVHCLLLTLALLE